MPHSDPGDFTGYQTPSYDDLFRDFGLGDIFDAFSGGSRRARKRAGADLRYDIEISLSDAFYGTKNTVEFLIMLNAGPVMGQVHSPVICGNVRPAGGPERSGRSRKPAADR